MSDQNDEPYDPYLSKLDHKDLIGWGVPLPSEECYETHVLGRMEEIEDMLHIRVFNGDPFGWADNEMYAAASAALQILRHVPDHSLAQLAQLCWLEESLLSNVCLSLRNRSYDCERVQEQLGRLASLVNERQIRVAQRLNTQEAERLEGYDADSDDGGGLETLPDAERQIVEEMAKSFVQFTAVYQAFPAVYEMAEQVRRQRVLDYLRSITQDSA